MTKEQTIKTIAMLGILIDIDCEAMDSLDGEERKMREKELDTCVECVVALMPDMAYEECDIVEIDDDGIAHVCGRYERNENDYGPHPLRYVGINGAYAKYVNLADRVAAEGTFAEFEANFPQTIYDDDVSDVSMTIHYAIWRTKYYERVTKKQFASGKLKAGSYMVV